jgi:hypothetical protein
MVDIFSIGRGIIYSIDEQGNLWWHKHVDYLTGGSNWLGPNPVGRKWNNPEVSVVANRVAFHR